MARFHCLFAFEQISMARFVKEADSNALGNLQEIFSSGGLAQAVMLQASRETGLRVELVVRSLREVAAQLDVVPATSAKRVVGKCLGDLRKILNDTIAELAIAKARTEAAAANASRWLWPIGRPLFLG